MKIRIINKTTGAYLIFEEREDVRIESILDEPIWRDVTGECLVEWSGDKIRYPDGRENELPPNYRLRKVQVVITPPGSVFELGKTLPITWALLVERKVSA